MSNCRAFVAVLLTSASLLAVESFAQSSPLIMKHADNLNVARTHGSLLLEGNVHFVHDSIQFRTQRASWNKNIEVVQCEGSFLFTHPSGYIQAERGMYNKKQQVATASGSVVAADSAVTYMFTGEHLVYNREQEILNMPQKPKLYQFDKQKNGNIDTVTIEADRIVYNKGESFAEAINHVKITQKDMVVTCDTGYFDRKENWLSMKGHPTCDMKNYHLTGDSIFLVLDETGKSLQSALVIRNAHGVQHEDPKNNAPGNVTEAFGDTLYCEFANNKIERLYVNLNAKGFFYETDLPDYRNLMDGERLDLYFNKGKMDRAVVSGKAQSTYFYVKKDRTVSGKNEAAGDTINILFDAQKNAVKSLKLLGASTMASGRYIDLEKERRNKEKARLDSLKAAKIGENAAVAVDKKGVKDDNIAKGENETPEQSKARVQKFRDSIRKQKTAMYERAVMHEKAKEAAKDSSSVEKSSAPAKKAASPAEKTTTPAEKSAPAKETEKKETVKK